MSIYFLVFVDCPKLRRRSGCWFEAPLSGERLGLKASWLRLYPETTRGCLEWAEHPGKEDSRPGL